MDDLFVIGVKPVTLSRKNVAYIWDVRLGGDEVFLDMDACQCYA